MPGMWSSWTPRARVAHALVMACLLVAVVTACGTDDVPTVEPTADTPAASPTVTPSPRATVGTPTEPTTTATEQPRPTATPTPAEPATPTEDTGMTTTPEPPPDVLTEADDGRWVRLAVGDEVPLQLDSAWFWDQPAVDGDAVELVRVDYITDPGFMEWIVTGVRPGDAVVSATGEPNCDDEAQCPPTAVRLAFRVD